MMQNMGQPTPQMSGVGKGMPALGGDRPFIDPASYFNARHQYQAPQVPRPQPPVQPVQHVPVQQHHAHPNAQPVLWDDPATRAQRSYEAYRAGGGTLGFNDLMYVSSAPAPVDPAMFLHAAQQWHAPQPQWHAPPPVQWHPPQPPQPPPWAYHPPAPQPMPVPQPWVAYPSPIERPHPNDFMNGGIPR